MNKLPKICKDCGPLPTSHFVKYVKSITDYILPKINFSQLPINDDIIDKIFLKLGLLKKETRFPREKISLRSMVFIDEAKKRGLKFWALKSRFGYLNTFHMERNKKIFSFEGLPRAEFLNTEVTGLVDDKAAVKKILIQNQIPAPKGKLFWLFEKKKACSYGRQLGFPLVVKPRSGSISHHVTANIRTEDELIRAIKSAVNYEPSFIVEKHLENTKIFRATIIDKKQLACVERIPAHVTGDGTHTIRELIEIKNTDPRRGQPRAKNTTLYKLVINDTSERLLREQGFDLDRVPTIGQKVWLQNKIILDLGADLLEVTPRIHPDNMALFIKITEIFNTRLIGIDFLAEDIGRSWKEQNAGIIELNSLPYIDMHHFPTWGQPINVAAYVCDLVEKYY